MSKIKILGLAFLISMSTCEISQAAQVSDFNIHGWENLTDSRKIAVQKGIDSIPSEIGQLHKLLSGDVYLVNGMLYFDGEIDPDLQGVYWHESRDIDLSMLDCWTDIDVSTATTHEFGHFVYFQSYVWWSDESKKQLETDYNYWKQYSDDCSDTEETFAFLYSMYRGVGGKYLSQASIDMVKEAEEICNWYYNELKDSDFEFGPGMGAPVLSR